jgi:hypothetical protein
VAGERAISKLNDEDNILHHLCKIWGISQPEIVPTAERFFTGYKKLEDTARKQQEKILALTIRGVIADPAYSQVLIESDQQNPTLYFSFLKEHADSLKKAGKGVVFVGENFVYGLLGNPGAVNLEAFGNVLKEKNPGAKVKSQDKVQGKKGKGKGNNVDGILEFSYVGAIGDEVKRFLGEQGFRNYE